MIKAIETVYNGYRFRSRLEARWAVFFDTLGIEYQYEPEGLDLGNGVKYLPDFWLPKQFTWFEVKPSVADEDFLVGNEAKLQNPEHWWRKCNLLHFRTWETASVMVAVGEPYLDSYFLMLLSGNPHIEKQFMFWVDGRFEQCLDCGSLLLARYNFHLTLRFLPATDRDCKYCHFVPKRLHSQLEHAYTAARQARFEHGERGGLK